jgi:hypothetical protein
MSDATHRERNVDSRLDSPAWTCGRSGLPRRFGHEKPRTPLGGC